MSIQQWLSKIIYLEAKIWKSFCRTSKPSWTLVEVDFSDLDILQFSISVDGMQKHHMKVALYVWPFYKTWIRWCSLFPEEGDVWFRQIRCLRRWRSKPHLIVIIIGYPYKRYPTRWFFNCNVFVSKLMWQELILWQGQNRHLFCVTEFSVLNWLKPLEYGEKEFLKTTS